MTRTTRALAAFVLLALLAVVGGWASAAMYSLAEIYSDPLGFELEMFSVMALPVVIVISLLVGLAFAAAATAPAATAPAATAPVAYADLAAPEHAEHRPRRRRLLGGFRAVVRGLATALVVMSLVGILVGNHLGVEAKRLETSEPPHCGIANPGLARTFETIDHPGYFGGGTSSRSHCSFLLTVADPTVALADYEKRLRAASWQVAFTDDGLEATGGEYRFRAIRRQPDRGDTYLDVTLRDLDPAPLPAS